MIDLAHNRVQIRQAIETQLHRGIPPRDVLYGSGAAGPRITEVLARVPLEIEKTLQFDSDMETPVAGHIQVPTPLEA